MEPTSYTIQISEAQREFIVLAFGALPDLVKKAFIASQKGIEQYNTDFLERMFQQLPYDAEVSDPDIVHGFCL